MFDVNITLRHKFDCINLILLCHAGMRELEQRKTMYTTHSRTSDTRIYINIHRTRGKAIIGMALQAIRNPTIGIESLRHQSCSSTSTKLCEPFFYLS